MHISIKTVNEVKVVEFKGSLDNHAFPHALDQLSELVEKEERKILVSFEKPAYISSAGLRVLLTRGQAAKTQRRRNTDL